MQESGWDDQGDGAQRASDSGDDHHKGVTNRIGEHHDDHELPSFVDVDKYTVTNPLSLQETS